MARIWRRGSCQWRKFQDLSPMKKSAIRWSSSRCIISICGGGELKKSVHDCEPPALMPAGSQSSRFRIRDFFNDAEPDAFALRAAAKDEFSAGGLDLRGGFVPWLGRVASQASYLPVGCAFFCIHNFLAVFANRQARPGAEPGSETFLHCMRGFVAILLGRNKWKETVNFASARRQLCGLEKRRG